MKTISIFGATGSIGQNAIEVIKNSPKSFQIMALTAGNDVETLIKQSLELNPKFVAIASENHLPRLKEALKDLKNCQISAGAEAILEIAKIKCDLAICAIACFAGMMPTLNAIKAGSNIALANKESLVCAGEFLIKEAQKQNVKILPVDSEHNAIFQIFENHNLNNIDEIILTASGGPFFNKDVDFSKITPTQALKHPNWKMGAKISIDSATMMNKGLEVIEAFYLFPVKKQQIKVLIHPQSIIHGIVNYNDGASLSMLSLPDMKVPISYALAFPNRMKINHQKIDLARVAKLEFFDVDLKKFPAFKLCTQALKEDGLAPTILNAANEIAVARFLNNEISFDKITQIVEKALEKTPNKKPKNIEEIINCDLEVRKISKKL
jgi:1-deoxy-D-xylulose-5-phosphate reductoisomerase